MPPMIHKTAIIGLDVELATTASIGAYVVIDGPARIGEMVTIEPHTIISGTVIGQGSQIGSHSQLLAARLADNVTVGQGVRIENDVTVGEGTKIWHHSVVMQGAAIGRNCSFGQNVHIAAGVEIGNGVKVQGNIAIYAGVILHDNVFLGPAMVFTNVTTPRADVSRKDSYAETIVEEGATIGANATIVCGHTIGTRSFVAAGALVTKDVPPYTLVASKIAVAIPIGPVCRCGEIGRRWCGTNFWCERCERMIDAAGFIPLPARPTAE